jgi:hypothetical protein
MFQGKYVFQILQTLTLMKLEHLLLDTNGNERVRMWTDGRDNY